MKILRIARSCGGSAVLLIATLCAARVSAQQITLVSPDNGSLTVGNNLTGRQATFTVSSQSSQSSTRTLSLQCSGQVTTCSAPSSVTFIQSTNVTVTFTSLAVGSGTIVLTAQGSTSSDQGSINVTVQPSWAVAVTPDAGTEPTRPANSGGYTASFTLQNLGANSDTYTFACAAAGSVVCGTPPAQMTRAAGSGPITVNMPYSIGAAVYGSHTLTLTASSVNASDAGSFTVPIAAVTVVPDGQVAPTRFSNSAGYSETFTVTNTGSVSNTFTFVCSGAGGITCATAPSATLASGAQTTVTMPYSTGAPGTGTLTLTATGSPASDQGSFSIPVALTLSSISNGAFSLDSHFLLQGTANSYDAAGRVTQFADPRNQVSNYQYDANQCNAGVTKVTRVHDASGTIDLVTDIACDASGFVSSVKDDGGTFRYFTYDGYGRLRQAKNNGSTVVKAYGYVYSRTSANNWTYQASSPNAVVDSTFLRQTPPIQVVVSTGYIDGLGRPIQSAVQDGTNYHVSATQYDLMGRTWRVWNPYRRPTAGYDAAFTTTATDSANNYFATTNAKPYVESQYRADPLNRVSRIIPQYFGTSPTVWRATLYGADAGSKRSITQATDESNKSTQDSTDVFGNRVARVLGYGSSDVTVTRFAYNTLGQRIQATDPRGLLTTYAIDTRGLLTSRTSPDAGVINSKYDKAGEVRYTQDANQAAGGQVYFANYDFAGRPLTSGVGAATFSSLDPDGPPQALETTQSNWLVVRQYDGKPSTSAFPWSRFNTQITPLTLGNVGGRLAAIASLSNGAWQVTLFSYDTDGRLATRYSYIEANGGASVLTAVNVRDSTLRYLNDAPTERWLTIGVNTFNQWYEYDGRGLLTKLFSSTGSTKPATADATDTYRPNGLPKDYQFQGGPLVPIRYTIRDQTERIGDPTGTTYPFSARYAYQVNGVVDTAEFYNGGSPAPQKRYRYAFGSSAYDALNRLRNADFSSWSGSAWTSTPAYDLAAITYDAAGNLTALQRYRQDGTLVDNLTYTDATTSNRLTALSDAVATTTETWDAETATSSTIAYDANGNLTQWSASPYLIATISYNQQNLPLSLTRSGTVTTYRYDDVGQRITKQVGAGNTEVYLRDGATTLGVFTLNGSGGVVSSYFNLVWQDRVIGRQTALPTPGTRTYDHFDALGSVRSVVGNTGVVQESYDYEPWGLLMAGRTLTTSVPTKEGFTGKEQDSETGLDYFGARHYMPALGRWTTVDPLSDKYPSQSPYHYSGNNPTGYRDVDGRYYVGTDGKAVTVTVTNGLIRLSDNASRDLHRMAAMINASGSAKAASQFVKVGNNETMVHFQISQATGGGRYGYHQAHNVAGQALEWDRVTQTFRGTPNFSTDRHGNLIYAEATITIYENLIAADAPAAGLDKQSFMVEVDAHESEHDLNTKDIQSIKDRGEGRRNDRNVEAAASTVGGDVRREILDKKKKPT